MRRQPQRWHDTVHEWSSVDVATLNTVDQCQTLCRELSLLSSQSAVSGNRKHKRSWNRHLKIKCTFFILRYILNKSFQRLKKKNQNTQIIKKKNARNFFFFFFYRRTDKKPAQEAYYWPENNITFVCLREITLDFLEVQGRPLGFNK